MSPFVMEACSSVRWVLSLPGCERLAAVGQDTPPCRPVPFYVSATATRRGMLVWLVLLLTWP